MGIVQHLNAVWRSHQHHVGRTHGKQPVGDDTDDVVDLLLQRFRIQNFHVLHIQNHIAVIGDKAFAIDRLTTQTHQFPRHMTARHGNHLHRKRKLTQQIDLLAAVDDADKLFRHCRHDLFPGQRSAATLDQMQVGIKLVGAIHINRQPIHAVQIQNLNAVPTQAFGGGLGTGYGTGKQMLDIGQGIDKEIGRGTGAHTDRCIAVEQGADTFNGRRGHRLFHFILGHAFPSGLWCY